MKDTIALTDIPEEFAAYGWIISQDCLASSFDARDHDDYRDEAGTMGPRNLAPAAEAALKDGGGAAFRMKDDDGEVYYKGRIVGGDYMGFEPLDDFGMPNAGCTSIEYWEGKEWRPL